MKEFHTHKHGNFATRVHILNHLRLSGRYTGSNNKRVCCKPGRKWWPGGRIPLRVDKVDGGRIKQHFDGIHAHYFALDNNRLLKVFREHAGLPAPGPDAGGWYDNDGFVSGLMPDHLRRCPGHNRDIVH